jgi:UDP-xylose/UDP-N-acetylglucosamine transporter B4
MAPVPLLLGLCSVFGGCQANMFSLEQIISHPQGKGFGATLTFLQFLFIALASLPSNLTLQGTSLTGGRRSGLRRWLPSFKKRELSLFYMVAITVVFWSVSTINNVVFKYHISVPLHTIFRSSSLVSTVIIGFFIFGNKYSVAQVVCAVTVTVGLVFLTLATSNHVAEETAKTAEGEAMYAEWLIGLAMLCLSVGLSAALGMLQDRMNIEARAKFGSSTPRWREAMFYNHAMSLLGFVFYASQIKEQLSTLPSELYVPIAINVLTQYVCIRGIFILVESTSAFTLTFVITLRKFMSLLFSVFWFGHAEKFTAAEWVWTFVTFIGASIYVFAPKPKVAPSAPSSSKTVVKAKEE